MKSDQSDLFYQEIGRSIKSARKSRDISQEALGKFLDLSRASIVNIEKGRQRPSVFLLWLIAHHLDVTMGSLIPKVTDRLLQELRTQVDKHDIDEGSASKIDSFIRKMRQ